ncbi:hypothetical protein N9D63_04045 [Opitutales bacterium]|jgi:hypothetical protein|nr:hypothetical protein [Opitutales bacterium]
MENSYWQPHLVKMRDQTIAELKRTNAVIVDNLPRTSTVKRAKGD